MLIHYLKIAVRQLQKYKFHTIVSVLCMAVGLTINGYIGAAVKLNINERNEILLAKSDGASIRYSEYRQIAERNIKGVYGMRAYSDNDERVLAYSSNVEELYEISVYGITPEFFRYHPDARGNLVLSGSDSIGDNEILISDKLAKRIFGNDNPIGKSLTLLADPLHANINKFYPGKTYRIAGVCLNIWAYTNPYMIYAPMHDNAEIPIMHAITEDGYSAKAVQKSLNSFEWKDSENGKPYSLFVNRMYTDTELWITVVLMVLFSLLIFATGLINFMKFMIQMFYTRQRELALRKCLGSDNAGLYMLLACEVLITLTLAFLFSCITSELSVLYFDYMNIEIFNDFRIEMIIPTQLYTTLTAFAIALVAILIPILRLRRASIRGELIRHRRGNAARSFMLGVQFMITIICFAFLGVAVMIEKSESFRHEKYIPKEELKRIFYVKANTRNWDEIRPLLEKLPVVEDFTWCCTETLFKAGHNFEKIYIGNDSAYADIIASGNPQYFEFFNTPVDGSMVPSEASSYVYIDKRLHQYLLDSGEYDGTVKMPEGRTYNVAGIIDNTYTKDWHRVCVPGYGEVPLCGSMFRVSPTSETYYFRIKDGLSMKDARKAFEEVYYKFIPKTFEVDIRTLDEVWEEYSSSERLMKHVALLMAFISLLVVVLSIYSTISLDAATRQKEIAIRKINGANRCDILRRFVVPYVTIYSVTFLIVYPTLACVYYSGTGGTIRMMGTGIAYIVGAMIYFGILALIAAITWHRIRMIMNVNPAEAIRRE